MSETTEISSATSLEQARFNWQEQIDRLIQRGYHRLRGITEDEYRGLMPEFQPQTEELRGFDIALLVDPWADVYQQLRLMSVEDDYDDRSDRVIANAEGVSTPKRPYQIWAQDGVMYKDKSGIEVSEQLSGGERGLTLIEGLALLRERPQIRRQPGYYSIGLLGSRTTLRGRVPQILHWTYNQNPSMHIKSEDPTKGEEESWPVDIATVNHTGGWPTCKQAVIPRVDLPTAA